VPAERHVRKNITLQASNVSKPTCDGPPGFRPMA